MTNQDGATEPTKDQAVPTPQTEPAKRKSGRGKKTKETEERVPMTFSVSADFAKRLKLVVSALDESSGGYVESRLTQALRKDLKRILEEMG